MSFNLATSRSQGVKAVVALSTTVVLAAGTAQAGDGGLIAWPLGQTDVVLRYETSGGRAARAGTEVPDRTIYGDGFVVWTDDEVAPTPGFASSVWTGRLDLATLRGLLTSARDSGFFGLEGSYQPATPPSSPGADPIPLPLDAEAETLTISLADRHRVSVRPAGWPGAPAAFRQLRDALLRLVPLEPRPFVAERYRLEVRPLLDENADDYPALPRSLADFDLDAESASQVLGRAQGEALAAWLAQFGTSVARDGRLFHLQLFAVPPRARHSDPLLSIEHKVHNKR